MKYDNTAKVYLIISFLLLVVSCSTPMQQLNEYPKTISTAFLQHEQTTIGRLFNESALKHPQKSGFALIRRGRNAFTDRIALTDLAEKTLDLQYYIWAADATGRILAERLIRAADRGVRVRVLIDDNNLADRDSPIASLDAHPNIEIRIFNPFQHRTSHIFNFMTDFSRLNHRMHNKLIVMDNAVAIVGGRNIGDHYFGVNNDANFRDLDIAAAGPVVRDLSHVFDNFWNGSWAIPIESLADRKYTRADLKKQLNIMRQYIAADDYPFPLEDDVNTLKASMLAVRDNLIWAPGKVIWDDPVQLQQLDHGKVYTAFINKLENTNSELLIESAYFVNSEQSLQIAAELVEHGVKIRVLTNSLASNDVIPAHAGYAKTRKELLQAGVDIYELKPDAGTIKKHWVKGYSKAALHAKAMVFDREAIFVGSYNFDPRSANINTEAGLYVESPELAQQLVEYMDEGIQANNSYHVQLDEDGNIYWTTKVNGEQVNFITEPETSFWQRFQSGLMQLFPIEQQL